MFVCTYVTIFSKILYVQTVRIAIVTVKYAAWISDGSCFVSNKKMTIGLAEWIIDNSCLVFTYVCPSVCFHFSNIIFFVKIVTVGDAAWINDNSCLLYLKDLTWQRQLPWRRSRTAWRRWWWTWWRGKSGRCCQASLSCSTCYPDLWPLHSQTIISIQLTTYLFV